jgi:signal recognition particle GTPase
MNESPQNCQGGIGDFRKMLSGMVYPTCWTRMTWWLMRLLGAAHPALEFDQRTRAELVQMLGIIDAMTAAERAQPQLVGRQRH